MNIFGKYYDAESLAQLVVTALIMVCFVWKVASYL